MNDRMFTVGIGVMVAVIVSLKFLKEDWLLWAMTIGSFVLLVVSLTGLIIWTLLSLRKALYNLMRQRLTTA
jgi:hypothetical protein